MPERWSLEAFGEILRVGASGRGYDRLVPKELEEIVRGAHECPLPTSRVETSKQESSESAALFHLAEDGLNDRFAFSVDASALWSSQLPSHGLTRGAVL